MEVESKKKNSEDNSKSDTLAARINRYITFGRKEDEITSTKEKNFVKNLHISKSTYLEIKQRIIKELSSEKEENYKSNFYFLFLDIANKINFAKYDIDKDGAESFIAFVISLKNINN